MEEDDFLPLSALQHWLFCPRQCALIHVERAWVENRFTAEGRLLHEQVDKPGGTRRKGVKTLRALAIHSKALAVRGIADVVEVENGIPFPVEYKRGRPKAHRADEVQLCAQALCLEEMFKVPVVQGALFYGKARRRTVVAMDDQLRALTRSVAQSTHTLIRAGKTPKPSYEKRRCNACSLAERCRPKTLESAPGVAPWIERQLQAALEQ